jgi:hypothetical protein
LPQPNKRISGIKKWIIVAKYLFYQKISTYDLTAIPTSLWFKGYGMLVKSLLLIVNRISQTLFCGRIAAFVFPFS